MGKSKRGSGPREGSNRAERVAARKARQAAAIAPPARPFAGLAAECDLVALRAFVPSATAPITVDGNDIQLVTVLPGAVPASVVDGARSVAAQVAPEPAEPGLALASALSWAATATSDQEFSYPAQAPDLAELLGADTVLDITVHEDFAWWYPGEVSPQVQQMVEQASEAIAPTARLALDAPGAAWWVHAGDKAHVRWVRPEDEDTLMSALARVHADGGLHLGEGSRFAGSFRTDGLLVPVFDLDPESHPDEWVSAATEFGTRLDEALTVDDELTAAQRRSRDGLRSRQITLR